jgi:hypothetical protein
VILESYEANVTYPRESVEFHLVLRRELTMHWRKRRLLLCELRIEIANIARRFLQGSEYGESSMKIVRTI